MTELQPRNVPCPTCPYRKDCPSGVWHEEEYLKLPAYDQETWAQPMAVFMCHDAKDKRTMCRGWLDVIDKPESLALRLAATRGMVFLDLAQLPHSGVPVFASGQAAAAHGIAQMEQPSPSAMRVISKLKRRKGKSA